MKISHCAATVKVRMPTYFLLPSRRTMITTHEALTTTNSSLEWVTRALDSTIESHSDTPTYDHFSVRDDDIKLPQFLTEFFLSDPGFIQRFEDLSSSEFDTSIAYTYICAGFIEINSIPHFVLINATKGNGFNTFSFQYQSMESVVREIPINCDAFNTILYDYFLDCDCLPNGFNEVGTNDQDTRAKLSTDRIIDDIIYSRLGLTRFNKELNLQISQGDNPEAIKVEGERIEWISGRLRVIDPRGIPVVSLMSGEAAIRQFEELEASLELALRNHQAVKITNGYIFNDDASDAVSTNGAAYSKASTRRRNTEAENIDKSNAKMMLESSLVYIPKPDGTLELYIIPAKVTQVRDINESPEIISLDEAAELITPSVAEESYLPPIELNLLLQSEYLVGSRIASNFILKQAQRTDDLGSTSIKVPAYKAYSQDTSPSNPKPTPIPPNPIAGYIADLNTFGSNANKSASAPKPQVNVVDKPSISQTTVTLTNSSTQAATKVASPKATNRSVQDMTQVAVIKQTRTSTKGSATQYYSQNILVEAGNIFHVGTEQAKTDTYTRSVSPSKSQTVEDTQSNDTTHTTIVTHNHMLSSRQVEQIFKDLPAREAIGRSSMFVGHSPQQNNMSHNKPVMLSNAYRTKTKALTLTAAAAFEEDTETHKFQSVNPFLRLLESYGS